MKRLAGVAAAMAIAMAWGCSSSDDNASVTDASTQDAPGDPCLSFTTSGDICPVPTGKACFPECTTGGCRCTRQADGQLRWSCTTDTSCFPDGGPLDDTGPPDVQPDDVSTDDASTDDAGDAGAGDAGDAGASDAGDASPDAAG